MPRNSRKGEIAVVGMACRFPGYANTPDQFWDILAEGRDVVTEIDDSRWSKDHYHHPDLHQVGRTYTWAAGVVDNIDRFDADFFGISPREAAQMDPQQRMLLEMVWEALEDGSQVASSLAGTDCGVFVGISGTDYANSRIDDPPSGDAYTMTGGTLSIAANRISYMFDLQGPSMAIDTACSSSMVALHQACTSLWRGETSSAIVGGINLLLVPFNFIGFARASMLSPRGRCRAFDASGDGYVRAEGGAVLFLKPLAAARAAGDPVHAVLVASGINSDGRTRGLSMPSSEAQEQLLRQVYGEAKLDPCDLAYLEAHGTGTAAGDPQEARAIGRALGQARPPGQRLRVGSVKTNVGHLEPASGMAGVVKSILTLERGLIPKTLHLETPNPDIDFDALNLEVVTEAAALAPGSARPLIGVNSFGFGGTNAHVVLGAYDDRRSAPKRARRKAAPLLLSARSEAALEDLARAHAALLREPGAPPLYDVAYSAAIRRQQHPHRLAVWGDDAQAVSEALDEFAAGAPGPRAVARKVVSERAPVAFLYSGNGSQWPGMASELLKSDKPFKRTVGQVDDVLRPLAGFSVVDTLAGPAENARLELTEIAQPLLFAVQAGLTATLAARGLTPTVVLGHSVGEVAAAQASGAFDLEQATRLIFERSQAQALTRGAGRMAALGLPPEEAADLIGHVDGRLEIAAFNSPTAVTVSGPLDALRSLGETVEAQGRFFKLLDLDYAFHSRVMDPVRDDLVRHLVERGLIPGPCHTAMVSTVTGEPIEGPSLGPEYWWHNIREPVRLDRAMASVLAEQHPVVVEVGPQPIMQGYLRDAFKAAGKDAACVSTLRRDAGDEDAVAGAVYASHGLGAELDRAKIFPVKARPVRLPGYPWQRERYWYQPSEEGLGLLGPRYEHPLLGYPVHRAEGVWENHVDTARLPYLADHVVGGAVLFPAAGFVEMALAASAHLGDGPSHTVEHLEIRSPLLLSADETKIVQLRLTGDDRSFEIRSRPRLSDQSWSVHVVGRLAGECARERPARIDIHSVWDRRAEEVSAEIHYARTAKAGLEYGPAFRAVSRVRVGGDETRVDLQTPEPVSGSLGAYHLHPSLLDGCLQALADALAADAERQRDGLGFLPFQVGRIVYYADCETARFCRMSISRKSARSILASFTLHDAAGAVVARLEDFRFRRMRLGGSQESAVSLLQFSPEVAVRAQDKRGPLPEPRNIAEALVEELAEQWYSMRRADYYGQVMPLFDALVASYAFRAVEQLRAGLDGFSVRELMRAAGIPAENEPWLTRLLEILEEDRLLSRDGDSFALVAAEELADPDEIWRVLLADFPSYLPEIALAGRAGTHLAKLLTGEFRPESLLANGSGSTATGRLLDFSPALRITERAARDVLQAIASDWPANQRFRVLEINLGSSGLTAEIAQVLPAGVSDYVLACEADHVARASAGLADCALVDVREVDLSESLTEQGFALHGFDVVLVTHVLHSVSNPRALLSNLRALMVADGILIALERPAERLSDLVFGAAPAWWSRSQDPAEPRPRLREWDEWHGLMEQTGFADTVQLAEPAPDVSASSYLVIARNPELVGDAGAAHGRRKILVASDADGASRAVANELKARLEAGGDGVLLVTTGREFHASEHAVVLDPLDAAHWKSLFAELESAGASCDEAVFLCGWQAAAKPPTGAGATAGDEARLARALAERCLGLTRLAGAAARGASGASAAGRSEAAAPRIWVATSGAASIEGVPGLEVDPNEAPIRGLCRVLENEHPDLRWKLVDVQGEGNVSLCAQLLASELATPDDEDEIVRTREARYALRAERTELDPRTVWRTAGDDDGVRLDFQAPGPLSNLAWREEPPRRPGKGEVQIRVRATGLNFRDVMYAMGMLSDEAVENGFAGASLGMECAGDITAVGPDVTGFEVGDPVVCFARACFASHVTTRTTALAHKPRGWSYTEAATIPSVFFTVYYALQHLAQLQPGERVLIHGAAGGVGLAAIQYARHCGAEIFATAGSDEKRDFLRLLGVEHVLDSRSLQFSDAILDLTGGDGVDVVLNSLSGEAVLKNLDVLKPFGRFLELGKRDFYENAKVGLRPFRNNITYYGIDADQLLVERSALAGRLFREMMQLFEQGAFRPLVHLEFPCTRAADAFRHMQQSKHIGKIVVTYDDLPRFETSTAAKARKLSLDGEACYLVTGGFGGFGLATARWLVGKGARHVALLGRRGLDGPDARAGVEDLEALGATVYPLAADVTDRPGLEQALARFGHSDPPIKGVVHAAMVLQDKLAATMSLEDFENVLAPKVDGAWNLHRCLHELDFFVLYSSATTSFGNPGQANYVAANLYLEALASHRRQKGLPGLCVGWGPIADVGYLARNDEVREMLDSRIGGRALESAEALDWLEQLMTADRSGLAVASLDWRAMRRTLPAAGLAKFVRLSGRGEEGAGGSGGEDVRALIADLSEEEVNALVTELLVEQIAKVMRTSPDKLDVGQSVYDLGMDSLMAVELHMGLEERFGINIPVMAVTEGASIAKLGARLAAQLGGGNASTEKVSTVARMAAQHGEEVGDESMQRLMSDMLQVSSGQGRLIQ